MKRLLLLPALLGSVSLVGCAKVDQSKAVVLAAIDRTEQQSREFTYTEKASGVKTVVKGVVQDDLRYSLAATVDGTAVASEVVLDDTRALQVQDGRVLQQITSATQAATAAGAAAAASASGSAPAAAAAPAQVPAALTTGGWVVDKAGATGLVAGSSSDIQLVGRNPLLDSITSLEYTRAAINAATDVVKFNPESESYRPKLDPFPRPASGTLRYDTVPPILSPRSSGTGGQLRLAPPDVPFFRLMAIYVRSGRVVEVRERIDVATRLRDPQSNLAARLGDFIKVNQGASTSDQAAALTTALNRQLAQTGKPLIRLRDMDLQFTSIGHSGSVSIPADAAPGDLSAVGAHGQLLYQQP